MLIAMPRYRPWQILSCGHFPAGARVTVPRMDIWCTRCHDFHALLTMPEAPAEPEMIMKRRSRKSRR